MTRNRVNHFFIFCSIVLSYLYLPMQICNARLITVEFTAEVTELSDSNNILEKEIEVGDMITGTYTYDTSVQSSPYSRYIFNSPSSGIKIQAGGFIFKTDPNNVDFFVALDNNGPGIVVLWDRFYIESSQNLMFYEDIQNTEIDISKISISLEDQSFPFLALLSEELPAIAPNLADWQIREIEIAGGTGNGRYGDNKQFNIIGHLTSATLISDPPKMIYVDDNAAGSNDGSNWENAYPFLQDALADANNSDKPVEIRIAQGIYQPDMGEGITIGDREATFHLMNQITLKGGYSGILEPNPSVQNTQLYKTILAGDLNGDDLPGFANRNDNSYHVISAIDVDESAYIEGLFITGGNADGLPANNSDPSQRRDDHSIRGGGLYTYNGRPIIKSCTFKDNFAFGYGGGLHLSGTARLYNCNFIGNKADDSGGAISAGENILPSNMLIKGCLFQGNKASAGGALASLETESTNTFELLNCTLADNRSYFEYLLEISYFNCIIWNNTKMMGSSQYWYCDRNDSISWNYNISKDPLFTAPGYWAAASDVNIIVEPNDPNAIWIEGDYHLKSQAGRWNPNTQSWVQDDVTSPCIDAGDPNSPIGLEPFPNGGYINMGAYGGTSEASKSYFGKPLCETIVAGDINGDCKVDELDMEIMLLHWLEDNNP